MKKELRLLIIAFISLALFFSPFFTIYAGKTTAQKEEKQKLNQYIEEGKELYRIGNYQGALEKWTEALKIDPWNDEVKRLIDDALKKISSFSEELNKGFKYLEINKLEKAKEIFNNLSKQIKPEDKKNYELLQKGIAILRDKEKKKRFELLLDKGDKYLNAGQVDAAERIYENAKSLYPKDERLVLRFEKIEKIREQRKREKKVLSLRSKARDLFDQGEFEKSKKMWEEVLRLKSNDEEAVLYISKINFKERERDRILALGKSYFDAGVTLFNQKKYNEAIDQFENAIAVNYRPEEAKKFIDKIKKTLLEIERKKNEEKVEKVAKYLKEGIKLYNLNNFREALKVLNKGLRFDPDNTQIKEYIVIVSIALKRQEEKQVPPSSPFYPLVENLKRLGRNAYENGDYLDAIKYYEEILLIFPFNIYAKTSLTKVLKKTDPKLASDILNNMINEAKGLIARGKKREAMEKLETVLEVDPGNKNAKILYGQLKARIETKKRIITKEMIKKAQELYNQGVEYYKKEDLKNAITMWRKAISINPGFVDARVALAGAETKLRNLKLITTKMDQEKFEDESISIAIKRHYIDGLNYYMSGLYKEAISEWQELLKLNPKDKSFMNKVKQDIKRAEKRLEMRG